ncbi:DUF4336 domain-containing protein [Candidatus Gracilibacteria bacterium]|jgi:Domain of unknown function (DUF4336)|nr:DUF4336 domain-containing protein [Candidatus Gracilibacteria bacterium]NJM90176.1 DUF4336 domain-containing protein [Hydrococcus sp. RU_2_2]NJP21361.1 DUF4336 domain-containing protein [Hydrococcus sp. CRU_1_1]
MLREIDKNIWVAEQPLMYFGLSVGTRMTIIRLRNGELIVISPIQVDEVAIAQINDIGKVSYIIAPNLYHHLFIADFKAIYPQAKLWIAPGLETKIPDLPFDKVIGDYRNLFIDEVECLLFDGFKTFVLSGVSLLNECVFFHRESQTLILTDTAFHCDETFPLFTQLAFRAIGGYKKLSPSWLEKLATTEKEKVKTSVQKVIAWDFKRVIMAHGSIIETDSKQKFIEGYEWFLGMSLNDIDFSL